MLDSSTNINEFILHLYSILKRLKKAKQKPDFHGMKLLFSNKESQSFLRLSSKRPKMY